MNSTEAKELADKFHSSFEKCLQYYNKEIEDYAQKGGRSISIYYSQLEDLHDVSEWYAKTMIEDKLMKIFKKNGYKIEFIDCIDSAGFRGFEVKW